MSKIEETTKNASGNDLTVNSRHIFRTLKNTLSADPVEKITETTIMKKYGLTRNRARYILNKLESEGYVRRVKGKGTFPIHTNAVSAKGIHIVYGLNNFRELIRSGSSATLFALMDGILTAPAVTQCIIKYFIIQDCESTHTVRQRMLNLEKNNALLFLSPLECLQYVEFCADEKIPSVSYTADTPSYNFIRHDAAEGTCKAITYLISQKKKKILFAGYNHLHPASRERLNGYRRALAAHGIPYDAQLIIPFAGMRDIDLDALRRALGNGADAVFISSQTFFNPVSEIIKEKKIQYPQNISLICFDDVPEFALQKPAVSAVSPPFTEIGRCILESLIDMIEFGYRECRKTFGCNLILRDSA